MCYVLAQLTRDMTGGKLDGAGGGGLEMAGREGGWRQHDNGSGWFGAQESRAKHRPWLATERRAASAQGRSRRAGEWQGGLQRAAGELERLAAIHCRLCPCGVGLGTAVAHGDEQLGKWKKEWHGSASPANNKPAVGGSSCPWGPGTDLVRRLLQELQVGGGEGTGETGWRRACAQGTPQR